MGRRLRPIGVAGNDSKVFVPLQKNTTKIKVGCFPLIYCLINLHRTFREMRDFVNSMKSEKDMGSEDGKVKDAAKVTMLDAKTFEDAIKAGKR